MAISKQMTLDNGAVGSYWKVIGIFINKITMKMDIQLALFADQAHAEIGRDLGLTKQFSVDITKEDAVSNVIALGYDKIKSTNDPDLDGAVDI